MTAYPAPGAVMGATLARVQARQAVTVACWLRYPTALDAELVALVGPGGSARLDSTVGAPDGAQPWRTWVDEVVASWAACLLGERALAASAMRLAERTEHGVGLHYDFRRLCAPDPHDRAATALLRHPDLLAPVARLHRATLIERLHADTLDPDALDPA
ncbi:MAG TPA: hypothetical protein VF163_18710 [Micromonosporaceae bacterium]